MQQWCGLSHLLELVERLECVDEQFLPAAVAGPPPPGPPAASTSPAGRP